MRKLFYIDDLEAEVFSDNEMTSNIDHDLTEESEEDFFKALESSSEADFPALELELIVEDGQVLVYEAASVFVMGDKEYMGLHPKGDEDGTIHIMELRQGEKDSIELFPVEDDKEFEEAAEAFYQLIADSYIEGME